MKKLLFIISLFFSFAAIGQTDEYYRSVDWKFYPDSIVQLTDSTYRLKALPFDYNDPGAINRTIGNYVVDYVGHRFEVIDSTATTITVKDIYSTGEAPQTGQIARCYRSTNSGGGYYVGSVDYSPLDESARWKINGADNEILWNRHLWPVDYIQFDTTYAGLPDNIRGRMQWNEDEQTLQFGVEGGAIDVNKELFEIYTDIDHNLNEGDVVSIVGVSGGRLAVRKTDITDGQSATACIGVVTDNLDGWFVRVTFMGKVRALNTSAFTEGFPVYASIINGELTQNIPPSNTYFVHIGMVEKSHVTDGIITVGIKVNPAFQDLSLVNGTPLTTNGQIPVWDETNGYWDFDNMLWGLDTGLIQSKAYDSTWNGLDSVAPSKNAVYDKIESMSAVSYCATTMTVNRGTLNTGTVADLCAVGGTDVNITELSGTDPLRITFAFSGVQRMNYFTFYGDYSGGASHVVWVEIYNPNTTNWDYIGQFGNSSTKQWYAFPIFTPNTYISAGAVQVRLNHQGAGVATNGLILDYVYINYGGAGGGTTTNALTMNNSGTGDASGTTFNGSAARTISYNTIGAAGLAASNTFTDDQTIQGSAPYLFLRSTSVGGTSTLRFKDESDLPQFSIQYDSNNDRTLISSNNHYISTQIGALEVMNLATTGQLKLPQYTGTTFDGTIAKYLGVDVNGNVVKGTISTGTTNHAALSNLSYATAGHTDFVSTNTAQTISGYKTFSANPIFKANYYGGNALSFYDYSDNSLDFEIGTNLGTSENYLWSYSHPLKFGVSSERMRIKTTGQLQFNNYTSSSAFTGTGVAALQVDASGNIITAAISGGGTTTNALTMNNSGTGVASGTTFDGSVARTISYNTIGAVGGSGTSGRVGIWNGSNVLTSNANITFSGSTLTVTGAITGVTTLTAQTISGISYQIPEQSSTPSVITDNGIIWANYTLNNGVSRALYEGDDAIVYDLTGLTERGIVSSNTTLTINNSYKNIVCNTGVTTIRFPANQIEGKVFTIVNRTASNISLFSNDGSTSVAYSPITGSTITYIPASTSVTLQYISTGWYRIQ